MLGSSDLTASTENYIETNNIKIDKAKTK